MDSFEAGARIADDSRLVHCRVDVDGNGDILLNLLLIPRLDGIGGYSVLNAYGRIAASRANGRDILNDEDVGIGDVGDPGLQGGANG
ncbi:MAG: hypothetical protein PHZ02_07265 [Desulfocapsaceae bacterium]|nr:hypothetical protein [Desulfocapsaceae bacterium]